MLLKCSVYCRKHRDASQDASDGNDCLQLLLGENSKTYININVFNNESALFLLNVLIGYILLEEQGVAANDSDSSPPRSRGRGRFEKSRIRGVTRGQSDDTRSTSSQGVDEMESSSNVRRSLILIYLL